MRRGAGEAVLVRLAVRACECEEAGGENCCCRKKGFVHKEGGRAGVEGAPAGKETRPPSL